MGIKGLKKFLREKYPETLSKTHISDFQNSKIVIDISSYIYKYKVVFADKWLNAFVNLICSLKSFDVHGNFIFDGKAPIEKSKEHEKRMKVKDSSEENIVNLQVDLETYKSCGEVSELLLSTMKKIRSTNKDNIKVSRLLFSSSSSSLKEEDIDVRLMEDYISRKESQIVNISKEDIILIKDLLTNFGVPYIQAPGEAEALGVYLCSNGSSDAILTEDTDVLAYGANSFISNLDTSSGVCEVIKINKVLEEMELNQSEFLDFCIMCGCDYNNNIPNVGIVNSLKYIMKYKNIDEFIEQDKLIEKKKKGEIIQHNYDILNHVRSRELFTTFGNLTEKETYKTYYWDTIIDFEKLYDFFYKNNCYANKGLIEKNWKEAELMFEDE